MRSILITILRISKLNFYSFKIFVYVTNEIVVALLTRLPYLIVTASDGVVKHFLYTF